jgi:KipI family sensor histidine kinase inhibitor
VSRAAPGGRLEALADDAWLLRLGDTLDASLNAQVHALTARIAAAAPAWVLDVVPAYASLAVFFDTSAITAGEVRSWLHAQASAPLGQAHATPARRVEVPVLYGGEHGPDLDSAAAELGLPPHELVARHAAGEYRVAMIGFAPGFPYLSGLDPALALPRLATPRTRVPAGSVAIAGGQAGIYPRESPGGWRLLGCTPLRLFDPAHEPPSLLQPGDRVRFVAIDAAQFDRLSGDLR